MMELDLIAFLLFFLIAALYSSVGHAGASGYLAVMALLSFAPEAIKPTSLALNIAVAGIASWRYVRAGLFDAKVFWPLAIIALPMAYLGGALQLPTPIFKLIAGAFLVLSAGLMAWRALAKPADGETRKMPWGVMAVAALPIGLLSGIIGVGGGIFLSPILIVGRYAAVRRVSGIAALFIFINSIAGLLGQFSSETELDPILPWWLLAVVAGAFVGTHFGVSRFGARAILVVLIVVLLAAGMKFLVA